MLILERKVGESIIIGDDITITVVDSCHHRQPKCRIGITAPREVSIHRFEVQRRIERERRRGQS